MGAAARVPAAAPVGGTLMAGSFLAGWREALRGMVRDQGVLLLLVIAPVFYGFFYPWPYATEVVQRVPTAVVDADHSSLSRLITRYAQASPRMSVQLYASEAQAQQALWAGQIAGYAVLPANLRRNVLLGRPVHIPIYGNASYTLLNKSALYGFAEAIGTVSAGIESRQLQARGVPAAQADVLRNPLTVQLVAAFNPTEGYGSSVVPAVAILILQQTLLMAAGMLVATWVEGHHAPTTRPTPNGTAPPLRKLWGVPASQWAGRIVALALPHMLLGGFYFGWVYLWQGYPHGKNIPAALLLLPVFSICTATIGCLAGLWLRNRERVLQVLLWTSLPLFFISGYTWPANTLPELLQTLRWLSPSTATIHAAVLLNQMGAPLHAVLTDIAALLALAAAAWAALLLHHHRQNQAPEP